MFTSLGFLLCLTGLPPKEAPADPSAQIQATEVQANVPQQRRLLSDSFLFRAGVFLAVPVAFGLTGFGLRAEEAVELDLLAKTP